jgi:hypothetical protein
MDPAVAETGDGDLQVLLWPGLPQGRQFVRERPDLFLLGGRYVGGALPELDSAFRPRLRRILLGGLGCCLLKLCSVVVDLAQLLGDPVEIVTEVGPAGIVTAAWCGA